MPPNADLLTHTINVYTQTFSHYFKTFLQWGEWLFFSLSAIATVWLCLWYAFDKENIADSMPGFLKEFFIIAFFYTMMMHAAPWLTSISDSAVVMNQTLTHHIIDPASIIEQGITIANKIILPLKNSGILSLGMSSLIIFIAYVVTITAFIAVALNLALTLLTITFFVSLSGLSLALGAFSLTRGAAYHTLEIVIGQSFKLLALYLVIDAGSGLFTQLGSLIPTDHIDSFDIYGWTTAIALLFWVLAKQIPQKAANLFTNALQTVHAFNGTAHSQSSNTAYVDKPSQVPVISMPIKSTRGSYEIF